jgi:hypothetical protein
MQASRCSPKCVAWFGDAQAHDTGIIPAASARGQAAKPFLSLPGPLKNSGPQVNSGNCLLENPEIADLADARGALDDQVGNEFRQQGARYIGGDIGHELRGNVNDVFFRRNRQTVFVTDTNFHVGFVRGGDRQ